MFAHERIYSTRFSFLNIETANLKEIELGLINQPPSHPGVQELTNQINHASLDYISKPSPLPPWVATLTKKIKSTIKSITVIDTQSVWLVIWNILNFYLILLGFLIALLMILIVDIARTHIYVDVEFDFIISTFQVVVLSIDMVIVRWRVRTVSKSKLRANIITTATSYFTKYFVFDLITLVTYCFVVSGYRLGFIRLLIYIKYFTLREISKEIRYKLSSNKLVKMYIHLLKVTFYLAIYSFFFGAVYVTIDLSFIFEQGYYYQNGFLWMTSDPKLHLVNLYENFNWYVWFSYGLFMQLQMVRGCGYGTPAPQNPPSQLWYSISALTMQFLFAYCVGQFISIFNKYYEGKYRQANQFSQLIQYKKYISDFSSDTMSYKAVKKLDQTMQVLQCQKIMAEHLSESLALKFKSLAGAKEIERLTFFNICIDIEQETELKFKLTQVMESKVVYQYQVLYDHKDCKEERLYFGNAIPCIFRREEISYFECKTWAMLGAREFFIDKKSLMEVSTDDFGIFQYLSKEKFMSVLRNFKKSYQKCCKMLTSMRLGEQSANLLGLRCEICSNDHLIQYCPLANFRIRADEIKQKSVEPASSNLSRRPGFKRDYGANKRVVGISLQIFLSDEFSDISQA